MRVIYISKIRVIKILENKVKTYTIRGEIKKRGTKI